MRAIVEFPSPPWLGGGAAMQTLCSMLLLMLVLRIPGIDLTCASSDPVLGCSNTEIGQRNRRGGAERLQARGDLTALTGRLARRRAALPFFFCEVESFSRWMGIIGCRTQACWLFGEEARISLMPLCTVLC